MKESNKYKFSVLSDLHLSVSEDSLEFAEFLTKLEELSKKTEKIILLGDIFTIWSGISPFNHENGKKLLKKIEDLSTNCEFYFLEGNYDFYICKKNKQTFYKCSENYIKLQINGREFIFTHGHLYTSFKDKLFMDILKSNIVRFLLEHKLIRPMVLKMQKQFENGSLSKKFKDKDLNAFTKKLMKRFKEENIICGHFHTSYKNDRVTIAPDYLSTNQSLSFDGESLNLIDMDNIKE